MSADRRDSAVAFAARVYGEVLDRYETAGRAPGDVLVLAAMLMASCTNQRAGIDAFAKTVREWALLFWDARQKRKSGP